MAFGPCKDQFFTNEPSEPKLPNAQALLPAQRVSSSGWFDILTLNATFFRYAAGLTRYNGRGAVLPRPLPRPFPDAPKC
jgi:hypothetical protein